MNCPDCGMPNHVCDCPDPRKSRDYYKSECQKANQRIQSLEEIVNVVAHIGVDFGHGEFNIDQTHIESARELMEKKQ